MRVMDLFAGIGGFTLGFEAVGFETVAFCEIDKNSCKVLEHNWPGIPIYNDITELTNERLKSDGLTGIDILTAGFPCQDISSAGNQAGIHGERSGLWSETCRCIGEIRPGLAVLENVTALIAGDNGGWFGRVLGDLAEIGYSCIWNCIPASQLGANHHRDRIWIIAYPNRAGLRIQSITYEGSSSETQSADDGEEGDVANTTGTGRWTRLREDRAGQPAQRKGTDTDDDSQPEGKGNVSDTAGQRGKARGANGLGDEYQPWRDEGFTESESKQAHLSYAYGTGLQGRLQHEIAYQEGWEVPNIGRASERCLGRQRHGDCYWGVEPRLGRVADGVPRRTHRLKQLGNAIVPQLAELLARGIIEHLSGEENEMQDM